MFNLYLQDVTHKVVEAIGTIAGSSLEQTTWLRRNLEVKASPQIVVEGANLEADVEGVQLTDSDVSTNAVAVTVNFTVDLLKVTLLRLVVVVNLPVSHCGF